MNHPLLEIVLANEGLAELDAGQRRLALRSLVAARTAADEVAHVVGELSDAIDGYGPLSELMRDEEVTDVFVNGPFEVWAERKGQLQYTDVGWDDATQLRAFIERLLACAGARADASQPIADARLDDGSRLHVVLPPLAPRGPLVSIRRFPASPFSMEDLVRRHMLDGDCARRLVDAVRDRTTIVISGGTGTGKTTLLNALLAHIGPTERVILIEEIPELTPACVQAVSLVARSANLEGKGEVNLNTLVRAALRMRPDRIVVGEVRGSEAVAALAAMSTGHEGSLVTLHARSAADAIERMTTLALQASPGASEMSLRRRVSDAFGLIVHLERSAGGRRVAEVHKVSRN
ncbi:MAG: Flp pilus assembly complex ATPase component TadA [Actinomycetota bacterium]|nr:Flp pilus assembly complex ATPase component TadA [Actinomycetota bacterium]